MQVGLTAIFPLMVANCAGTSLTLSAERAFASYVADLEARLVGQHANPETYIAVLDTEASQRRRLERQLMSGDIRVEPVNNGTRQVDGALLHHWRGVAFVRNATAKDMLGLLRDFHHLSGHYAQDVVSSRALTDDGEIATLAVRFKKQIVITIVLDAEYKVETRLSSDDRGYSISRSTHLWQMDDPGTARERRRPEGEDDGFLWHLNSYWSFARIREGLQIECEAVSLTRDIPPGFGWLIGPILGNLPRDLLESTLSSTRNALAASVAREVN